MSERLPMKTHSQARNTLSRLLRQYHAGELDGGTFRTLCYGFSCLLGYFKLEQEGDILTKLEELEAKIEEHHR